VFVLAFYVKYAAHMCFSNWFYFYMFLFFRVSSLPQASSWGEASDICLSTAIIIGRFFCCLALCRCVSSHIRFFFYGGLSSHVLALLIFSCIVSCLSQVLITLNKLQCQSYSSEDAKVVKCYLPKLVNFQGR
jgi:hypothetical protein